jgi:hypothetical protein
MLNHELPAPEDISAEMLSGVPRAELARRHQFRPSKPYDQMK